jgi:signal peptidase I
MGEWVAEGGRGQRASVVGRVRAVVEGASIVAIAILIARAWCAQGMLVPCRIVGGSMAETLLGAHCRVQCADCGQRFFVGSDPPPVRHIAVCPYCGYAENDITACETGGERVVLDKVSYRARTPRRWEVAAFVACGEKVSATQETDDKFVVKRIVGLPGEMVLIRDGEIYIDGYLERKSLAQQRAMAVLVHDADYPPVLTPGLPPRWRGEGHDSRWQATGGFFSRPHTPGNDWIDWLTYTHWRRTEQGNTAHACPISDDDGYNQYWPRRGEQRHIVSDLLLSFRIMATSGTGSLVIRGRAGQDEFQAWLDVGSARYHVCHNGRPIPGAHGKLPARLCGALVEFSLIDRQLILAIGRQPLVIWPYEPSEQTLTPTRQPFSLGTRELGITIANVRIYRDVYYTRPVGFQARWGMDRPCRLGPDEYFVLGDNPAVSADSRSWPGGPGVNAKLLMGKPLLVWYSPRPVFLGRWKFHVPDPMRIRYIR